MSSKQLWLKCYFAHWTQHDGAAVGPDRPALMASLRINCAVARPQRTQMRPCLLGPIDWEDASGCSHLSKSLTLHQLGLTTLVYPYTTHLSSSKCSVCVCVYVRVKGWHPLLTGAHWVPSTSQFRQRLTSVGIGHARLNNNLSGSPSSFFLLPLRSPLFSHRYIVSLSGSWLNRCSDCHR